MTQPATPPLAAVHPWPDPTPAMLDDPDFNAIWSVIKSWDINVPSVYAGYMGATGNHARAILDALAPVAESCITTLTAENEALRAALASAREDGARMHDAIRWALGYTDFAPREEWQGAFWWRSELRRRAGYVETGAARSDSKEEPSNG